MRGDAAINIKITFRATLLEKFGNLLTFKIWTPGRIHISGDVIKKYSATAQIDMKKEIEVALKQFENQNN